MELTYYGAGCLHVATKNLQLLIDPLTPDTGRKLPNNLKKDAILYTTRQAETEEIPEVFTIDVPGEYEMKDVSIQGLATPLHTDTPEDPKRGIFYIITYAEVRLLVLGNAAPELPEEQLEVADNVHAVVVPVGGHGLTLDGTAAAKLANQFEPRFVFPVHYDDGKTKYPMPQDTVDTFLHEMGHEKPEPVAKLKITTKDLGGEDTQIVLLEPQG